MISGAAMYTAKGQLDVNSMLKQYSPLVRRLAVRRGLVVAPDERRHRPPRHHLAQAEPEQGDGPRHAGT